MAISTLQVGNRLAVQGPSGGNTPLGEATVWPAIATPLDPLPENPRVGDRLDVTSLGVGNASGTLEYFADGWKLVSAIFDTYADLIAYPAPFATGAIASVEETGDNNENGVRYQYEGSWVRTAALTSGYTWVLSNTRDFNAVGLQEGDYGTYTPTGGAPVLLRYVAACPVVGGGTLPAWVYPGMYGRTNLQIVCYVEGSETPPAYGSTLQGYQYDRTGAATITSTGGYMQLDAPGTGSQFAFMTSPAISGAKRFYVQTELRGTTAGTVGQAGLFNLSAIPESQWTIASQRDVASGVMLPVFWNGAQFVAALTGASVRNGGNALPASTPWLVEGFSSGGAITDMMVARIDGFSYCSLRRNFDSATVSTNFNVVPLAAGNVSGASSGRLEIRRHYVFTSD